MIRMATGSATLRLLTRILIVWFLVSFGAGILFADLLNQFHLGGYPLGFWFAQQGSIYVFIVLIFYLRQEDGRHRPRVRRARGLTPWISKPPSTSASA